MKVRVMSITGQSEIDEVWKISRSNSTSKAEAIDAPLWDFVRYTLEITSTILERDKIARLNDIAMWAQTSRVTDPINFQVEEETELTRQARDRIFDDKARAVSQDEYRLHLPVQALTTYCINISARTLARMIKSDYITGAILDSLLHDLYNIVKPIDFNYQFHVYKTIELKAKYALYSQLVRHRNINISLIERDVSSINLSTLVNIEINASNVEFSNMINKRTCWLVDTQLWEPILNHPDLQYLKELPCKDGKCPFSADAEERINGTDPGEPCPRYEEIR